MLYCIRSNFAGLNFCEFHCCFICENIVPQTFNAPYMYIMINHMSILEKECKFLCLMVLWKVLSRENQNVYDVLCFVMQSIPFLMQSLCVCYRRGCCWEVKRRRRL